jgi:heat-inducible transcriptional repressor
MSTQAPLTRIELILNLIIEHYLAEGAPISSKFIASELTVSASPATVRNDMCQLEKQGLIYAPYTSAGRLPTEKALRKFVDGILKSNSNSLSVVPKIIASLGTANTPERICEKTAKLLADMTSCAALVVISKADDLVIRQVELVRLADRRVLVALIDEHDTVQNRVVELKNEVSDHVIAQTLQLLNMALSGHSLKEGAERLPYFIKPTDVEVFEFVKETLFSGDVETQREQIFSAGEISLLNTEISDDTDTLKQLITSFSDLSPLLPCFNQSLRENIMKVFIGEEMGVPLFDGCTLVVSPFNEAGKTSGYVAVMGPKRMDYSSVLPAVKISANILTSALNRDFQSP